MARSLRLHVPGGFYHVTLRGNHRHPIFYAAKDRDLLDRIVERTLEDLGARLHAYCWMTNHIHLLLQVADAPLGKIMQRIASHYARVVQQHLQTTGHLFERRYHSLLVDADNYLLTLLRYIHFNPVRAGLVKDPASYPWSSHRAYLGQSKQDWITTDFALALFAVRRDVARARYSEFMGTATPDRWGTGLLTPNDKNGQILGSDDFVARVGRSSASPETHSTLADLFDECTRKFRCSRALLVSVSRNRRLSSARAWIAREAASSGIATVSAVAREMQRSEAAIRRLMQRHGHQAENE
jgi:REP element-mobilizing transposase RayT